MCNKNKFLNTLQNRHANASKEVLIGQIKVGEICRRPVEASFHAINKLAGDGREKSNKVISI